MPERDPMTDQLPPRWRTPRRVAVGFAVLLAAVAGLRGYVGHVAAKELAAAEHAARAAGLPWTFDDLLPPPIPPGRTNAADLYRQAFALKVSGVDGPANSSIIHDESDPRSVQQWDQLAARSAKQYGPMFALARQARGAAVDWGVRRSAVSVSTLYASFRQADAASIIANEIADHALFLHLGGNDSDAIETSGDVIALARAVDSDCAYVSHIVALGIYKSAFRRVAAIALDADFRTPEVVARWRSLLALLEVEERGVSARRRLACSGDEVVGRGALRIVVGYAWLMRPLFDLAGARRSVAYNRAGVADDSTPFPPEPIYAYDPLDGLRLLGTPVPITPPLRPVDFLRRLTNYNSDRFNEMTRRVVMESRLLRVRIAAKLYHADHGNWPASVDALVPTYLPAVPRSPHRPAVARLGFAVLPKGRPDGADRPMAFVDVFDSRNPPPARLTVDWTPEANHPPPFERGRQWRDVDAWPLAAIAASTQPAP